MHSGRSVPAAPCRAWVCTQANSLRRMKRFMPVWVIRPSSPRSAPVGRNACGCLMSMIECRRVNLTPLLTHRFALDDIEDAFDLFSHQQDGVLKVALYPDAARREVRAQAPAVAAVDELC